MNRIVVCAGFLFVSSIVVACTTTEPASPAAAAPDIATSPDAPGDPGAPGDGPDASTRGVDAHAPADGATKDASANDAALADASGACNDLAQLGQEILIEQVAANAPALGGGAIPDGTYVLVEGQAYTGPGGPTGPIPFGFKETLRVSGTVIDVRSGSGAFEAIQRYTVAIQATKMTWTKTCPSSGGTKEWEYGLTSAGGKTSLLLKNLSGEVAITRLEKQ